MEPTTKRCPSCKLEKDLGEFGASRSTRLGVTVYCKPCIKMRSHEEYLRNRDAHKARESRYAKSNPEKSKARKERYLERHPEVKNRWYWNNKERSQERLREWRRNNPEKKAQQARKHRATRLGVSVNDLMRVQWEAIQESYDHRCAYCGKKMKGKLCQEHITPISKGGNNTLSNVVPACPYCNSIKATGPVLRPVQPLLIA